MDNKISIALAIVVAVGALIIGGFIGSHKETKEIHADIREMFGASKVSKQDDLKEKI